MTESFVALESKELKHLLALENKNVESEKRVYQAVIGWINHDVTNREKYVEELLSLLNFSEMSLAFLSKVVATEKLIQSSFLVTKAVLSAVGNPKTDSPASNESCSPDKNEDIGSVLPLHDFVAVDNANVWTVTSKGLKKHKLKYDHTGGCAINWKSDVLAIGGCNTKVTERFSLDKEEFFRMFWSERSTIAYRYDAAAVNVKNSLYLTGGLSAESSAEYWRCPSGGNSWIWSEFQAINFGRFGHALAYFAGTIYVVGGNAERSKSLFGFDIDRYAKSSIVLAPMQFQRTHLTAVVLNERIYAIGGAVNEKATNVVEAYMLLRNVWERLASLNVARRRLGACVLGNQIVVAGGGSTVVEVYDEKNNKWNIIGDCEELKDVFDIFPC